jgi:hypothetical protein
MASIFNLKKENQQKHKANLIQLSVSCKKVIKYPYLIGFL